MAVAHQPRPEVAEPAPFYPRFHMHHRTATRKKGLTQVRTGVN